MDVKIWRAMNEVFKRLNNLRRWTEFITEGKYDEIGKQSLNCCICFILAVEAEKINGMSICWERFPKIAIYRAFQKAYVNYDTPEHILKEICEMGGIPFEKVFAEVTNQTIEELTSSDFVTLLKQGCGTTEEKIYKAATKIATFLELREIQGSMNGDYVKKYDEIIKSMVRYEDIPGFKELSNLESPYFRVFRSISRLRNQNRWAAYSYRVGCSVLGHLFDTACFAYIMSIEEGYSEEVATKNFFMGIFHDVPEAFTRDIPSPIKDRIPGFRELTEKYELQMMERNVYPFISKEASENLKRIMFEEDSNAEFKTLMKGADYMSAVSEIWRQFKAGTRDESFVDAIIGHKQKFESGIAKISSGAESLLDDIISYSEKIDLK